MGTATITSAEFQHPEALRRLRHLMRATLHEVIAYSEIIVEDAGDAAPSSFMNVLYAVISAAENTLRAVNCPVRQHSDPQTFASVSSGLLHKSSRLFDLAGLLPTRAPKEVPASIDSDLAELRAAINRVQAAFRGEPQASGYDRGSDPAVARSREVVPSPVPDRGVLLVVESSEGNREVLARHLLRDGCDVFLAENGRQCLNMVRRYDFDLVLLDVEMPEIDGIAVLREMKADPKLRQLPVVMISAMDKLQSIVRGVAMGADDYLAKPFDPALLRVRISGLLERKRLRDDDRRKTKELHRVSEEMQRQKQQTEMLLLNILPETIAAEIKLTEKVAPIYFGDVTILFDNFLGFTVSTEHLSAQDLIRLLHQYFSAFDYDHRASTGPICQECH